MFKFNKLMAPLGAAAISVGLVGCNSDDIILGIDIADKAYLKFVNNTDSSKTFYMNSVKEDEALFRDDHRTRDVSAQDASESYKYTWIKGFSNTRVGVEDSNSRTTQVSTEIRLRDKRDYWAIAWSLTSNDIQLSAFEQKTFDVAGEYTVRVFANAELDIVVGTSTTPLETTEIGKVTGFIGIQNCNDLEVGGISINLCQNANVGSSYLVVVDDDGEVLVLKET